MLTFQSAVAIFKGRKSKRAVGLYLPMCFDGLAVCGLRSELDNASAGRRAIAKQNRSGNRMRRDGSFAANQGKNEKGDNHKLEVTNMSRDFHDRANLLKRA